MLDIISQDSNEVYRQLGLVKAAMSLIQEDQLETFFDAMGPTIQMSGGSVANSIAGVAALGGTCGYIGKVADDDFGQRFTHDLTSMGVEVDLAIAAPDEGATGRCHVFITDDAQRTMATYLGASNQLHVADINETSHRSLRDHLRRGLPVRPPSGQGGDSQGRELRARLRLHGRAVAVGHVLRRSAPSRLPGTGHQRRRRPAVQRDRDLLALPGAEPRESLRRARRDWASSRSSRAVPSAPTS